MRHQRNIQIILSLVMLFIFTLSIAPKKYLHDLIADHTDYYSFNSSGETSFSKKEFNCDSNDVVVSTPFIESEIRGVGDQVAFYCSFIIPSYFLLAPSAYITKDSRGPPGLLSIV